VMLGNDPPVHHMALVKAGYRAAHHLRRGRSMAARSTAEL
jgi:hypothetical protein